MNKDILYVEHVLESIDLVYVHLQGKGKQGFMNNVTIRDAVLRALQIMAESCQRLSHQAKKEMAEIEWHKIAGFRNVLVHDYLGEIDPELVWNVIEKELPSLQNHMKNYKETL